MLEVHQISARYGAVQALTRVDMEVNPGEVVCLIGANGAGKTTLLNVISGLHPACAGEVRLDGKVLPPGKPASRVAKGVVQVPEGRQVFGPLSVMDNLMLGAFLRVNKDRKGVRQDLQRVLELFPVLAERKDQPAGTLSGGEQQMLALGRGLMSGPRLLLLDEPSLGLAPLVVQEIFQTVKGLPTKDCAVLLVEQNAVGALEIANRGYVMAGGRIAAKGSSRELSANGEVREAFLGRGRRRLESRTGDIHEDCRTD